MPYKSKKQQRFMNAVHPDIAARWNKYPMPKYQASSTSIEGDLISKVLMNRNKDKDFVQRAYALGEYPNSNMFTVPGKEFGTRSSHLMSWGEDDTGQAYMYPSILNPKNEAIKVPNQYADYISSQGYKNATGMNTKKQKGGSLPSYQKSKTKIEKSPQSQVFTYESNPEWFDNQTVIGNNPRASEFIKKLIYAGTHGYNPNTGALHKLDVPVHVPPATQEMATEEWGRKSHQERFESPTSAGESMRKGWVGQSMQDVFENPITYAPGVLASLPALAGAGVAAYPGISAALTAPAVIAGRTVGPTIATIAGRTSPWTAGKMLTAGFAGHGLTNIGPHTRDFIKDPSLAGALDVGVDLLETSPLWVPPVLKGYNLLGKGVKEGVYHGINPVGYNVKKKITGFPKEFVKNINRTPEERAINVGKQFERGRLGVPKARKLQLEKHALEGTKPKMPSIQGKSKDDILKIKGKHAEDLEIIKEIDITSRIGKNRLDAFRVGLGLDQKFNTFTRNADGSYRINNMIIPHTAPALSPHATAYLPASLKQDSRGFMEYFTKLQAEQEAAQIRNYGGLSETGYSKQHQLQEVTKKYMDKITAESGIKLRQNVERTRKAHSEGRDPTSSEMYMDIPSKHMQYLFRSKSDPLPAWTKDNMISGSHQKLFDKATFDIDRSGIMGGYRWDIGKTAYTRPAEYTGGNAAHFQYNDTWSLNPLSNANITRYMPNSRNYLPKPRRSQRIKSYLQKKLGDIEFLNLVGGKPFQIRGNYIVDEKTGKIIKGNFKQGGPIPSYKGASTSITGYQGKGPNSGPYIIPSNNITMKGVPFPLTGTPFNEQGKQTGETIPMLPGQNYQFPPGSSVYETPLMKEGGYLPQYQSSRNTIYTSDPNDPKYQDYMDSNRVATNLQWYNTNVVDKIKSDPEKFWDIVDEYYGSPRYKETVKAEKRLGIGFSEDHTREPARGVIGAGKMPYSKVEWPKRPVKLSKMAVPVEVREERPKTKNSIKYTKRGPGLHQSEYEYWNEEGDQHFITPAVYNSLKTQGLKVLKHGGSITPKYQSSRDPIPDSLDSNILDVDEDTLNELVNAGADIERIPDIDMSQVKQATIEPTPRTLGHKIEDWWKKPQVYNVPKLNIETGKWEDKPYYTSFANEWERTGWEPTVTATSAGGLGAGFRGYFPYSDPAGVGLEVDVDPTGPGFGVLLNNYRLRQAGNYLADKIGDNPVGNWFKDWNLPPGFTYGGGEWAGNAFMPFIGVTASMHDTEKLQTWLEHPDNSGLNTSAEVFKHSLGPGLWGWNQGPKIGGQFKISNPADVMGKPLWKSPDLFGGKKIHNPISGTGEGIGGRTGIRGGNVILHKDLGKITPSFRGGFESMKNDVLALAKEKGITPKAAYSELAANLNIGKGINKTGIPKVLDYAGEKLYGTKGAGAYNKSGTTLANSLRNMKIPYGKVINHPLLWKGLSSALMAPDAANTLSGMFHQPGDPVKDYWRTFSDDQYGLEDPELQSAKKYGAFPRVQRFFDPEAIEEDIFNEAGSKDKFVSKKVKEKQKIGETYEKKIKEKHGVVPEYDWRTAKTRQGVWYDEEGNQVKVPEGAKFEKRKSLSYQDWKPGEEPWYSFMVPDWISEASSESGEFKKERYGWEASYFDKETEEWVDLWSYDLPALRGAQRDVIKESNKKTAERRKKALSDTPDIFKKGGEIIDIDDELLKELISKNADIEIL